MNKHEDNHRDSRYSYDDCEAALCIWEYSIACQQQGDDSVFEWLAGGEGAACARSQCISLGNDCDESYQRAVTLGYDECFDWEFVPRWVRLAMEISAKHDLVGHWIEYMGLEIYREYEGKNAVQHF